VRFYPLEKLINLREGYVRQFKIDHLLLLLIQQDNERFLIEARCPHRDHPLDVASIDQGAIRCALHHYQFSLQDGSLLVATDETCRNLRTFELIYQMNEIGVMLDD
jgi:nitrite reductase/ring-hydroxylating ferredoxin subunit